MKTSNRLSAEYLERVEHAAKLRFLKRVERWREMVTEGGRVYGQIKMPPEQKVNNE